MLQTALRRRLRPVLALVIAAACAGVALPAAAGAAPGAGSVKLTVGGKGKAAKALRASGVRVAAVRPATKRGARIALPVRQVAVAGRAKVVLAGGIRFRAGRRALRVGALRLVVAPRRAVVSARAGRGARFALFSAALPKGRAKLDRAGDTARLAGARLALTRAAVRKLRRQLGARGLAAGAVGKVGVNARPRAATGGGGGGTGGGGTGGGGGGTGGGGGGPESGPIKNEPPVLARPAGAVDVSDVSIEWYPRDTWVRYLSSGTGAQDGLFATNGATKMAPFTTAAHPCSNGTYGGAPSDTFDYGYTYAAKSGWYDESDQSAAIYGQGTVRFVWKGHTVDLAASDIELELNSTAPRSIFRFSGSGGTAYPNQRAVLTELDLAGQPQVSGNTRTYTALDTALTEDGSSVFAGFYAAGDPFGCVSVSFKVPS